MPSSKLFDITNRPPGPYAAGQQNVNVGGAAEITVNLVPTGELKRQVRKETSSVPVKLWGIGASAGPTFKGKKTTQPGSTAGGR